MSKDEEAYRCLASLTVFKDLYDHNDVYDVITEFIKDVIREHSLWTFTATEITNYIKADYCFCIPVAIIETSLRRLKEKIVTEKGKYTLHTNIDELTTKLPESQRIIETEQEDIFDQLCSFVKKQEQKDSLSEPETSQVTQSFCQYLLQMDTPPNDEYSIQISAFLIAHKDDSEFISKIEKIREGVILHTGLLYNDPSQKTWKQPLTIFLDTEILFHATGLNGALYQEMFQDFFNLVCKANRKNENTIQLKYFDNVKYEIDKFFTSAKFIVSGKGYIEPGATAMENIVNGCETTSDVEEKRSDFYGKLNELGIKEEDTSKYYDETNQKYNLTSGPLIKALQEERSKNGEESNEEKIKNDFKMINLINILRQDKKLSKFKEISYVLVTGDGDTLFLAQSTKLKDSCGFPLACSITFITNRLWFVLHEGFGNDYPKSFSVIPRAQILLSSYFSQEIMPHYRKTLDEYHSGKISIDVFIDRLTSMRDYIRKPEDFSPETVSSVVNDANEEKIKRVMEERALEKQQLRTARMEVDSKATELKQKDKELQDTKGERDKLILLHDDQKEYREVSSSVESKEKKYRFGTKKVTITLIGIRIIICILISAGTFFVIRKYSDRIVLLSSIIIPVENIILFVVCKDRPNPWKMKKEFETKIENIIFPDKQNLEEQLKKDKERQDSLIAEIKSLKKAFFPSEDNAN